MFFSTFKSTYKNLVRSIPFWLFLGILTIIAVYEATEGLYNYYDPNLGEVIYDTDPRFVLSFAQYVQTVMNACVSNIMMYGMPLFTVVTTVIILFRDYGDGFFEIEKSCNMRPMNYYLGRIASLLTVNVIVAFLATALSLYVYVFTRGGVEELGLLGLLGDSLIRISRVILFVAFPCVLFYITFTYAIGCLLKNGIAAAIAGLGYAIFYYVVNLMFRFRLAKWYFEYLSPLPEKVRSYFHYFGSEWHTTITEPGGDSLSHALVGIGCLIGVSLLYAICSYLRIRKREL